MLWPLLSMWGLSKCQPNSVHASCGARKPGRRASSQEVLHEHWLGHCRRRLFSGANSAVHCGGTWEDCRPGAKRSECDLDKPRAEINRGQVALRFQVQRGCSVVPKSQPLGLRCALCLAHPNMCFRIGPIVRTDLCTAEEQRQIERESRHFGLRALCGGLPINTGQ